MASEPHNYARRDAQAPRVYVTPQARATASRAKGYLVLSGIGLFAMVYMLGVYRASDLDAQAAYVRDDVERMEFEVLQARRACIEALHRAGRQAEGRNAARATCATPAEPVLCPKLPPEDPSILADMLGHGDAAHVARSGWREHKSVTTASPYAEARAARDFDGP